MLECERPQEADQKSGSKKVTQAAQGKFVILSEDDNDVKSIVFDVQGSRRVQLGVGAIRGGFEWSLLNNLE